MNSAEVVLPTPGPDAVLDYSKNDEWAVGMIVHELFSPTEECAPFAEMERPATYSDAGYVDAGISEHCKPFVQGLLRVAIVDRTAAPEASRQAKRYAHSNYLLDSVLAADCHVV